MSNFTVANVPRLSRERLAEMIRSKKPGVAVIDVRDQDYIGGHINGCLNVPVATQDYRMPELVRNLRNSNTVVFHCALSQQRGPSSALRYLRERERMNNSGQLGITTDGEDIKQRVYVLDGGFQEWQEAYGDDKELTEGYQKDLWDGKW